MADTIDQQVSEINQQLEALSTSIQTSVTQMSDTLVNGLGPALSGIIANMQELVNQAVIIQQTLANMWDASQASEFWDKLSTGADVLGGLASAISVYSKAKEVMLALSKSAILAWAKESAAMVVTTAATWAQQAATVALNAVQAILNGLMNMSPLGWILTAIGAVVAAVVLLWQNCDGFREALTSAWEAISAGFSACWDAIVAFFTTTLPEAFQAVITFVQENWQGLLLLLVNPIAGGLKLLYDNNEGFREWANGLWESVKQIFTDAWDAIAAFFTETIPGIITTIVTFFAELPDKIWEWLVGVITKVETWVSDMVAKAGEVLPGFITSVVTFFAELQDKIWSFLCNVVSNVVSWAANLVSTAQAEIPRFIASVATYFNELPGKVLEVGKNLVRGLWNGISEAGEWLWGKLTGWCNGILDKIKGIFGIHSPSTVMSDVVGKNLALGMAEGITDNADAVTEAFDGVLDDLETAAENCGTSELSMGMDGVQVTTLQSGDGENPAERIRAMMEAAGRTIPEGFFTIGDLSAEQFGNAFEARLQAIFEQVRYRIAEFQQRVVMQFTSEAKAAVERANQIINNNGNTYHNNYTITAANTSPKATADAIQNQMTMQRMLFA